VGGVGIAESATGAAAPYNGEWRARASDRRADVYGIAAGDRGGYVRRHLRPSFDSGEQDCVGVHSSDGRVLCLAIRLKSMGTHVEHHAVVGVVKGPAVNDLRRR